MHVILGFGIAFVTFLFALPILIEHGIQPNKSLMRSHKIIGVAILAVVSIQILLGLTTNILKQFRRSPPFSIHVVKWCHRCLGYALLILGKVQIYLVLNYFKVKEDKNELFVGLLIADCVLLVVLFVRKVYFPNMGKTIMLDYSEARLDSVKSVKQLNRSEEEPVGVFGNYVFELKTLLKFHPAGFRLI